MDDRATSIFLDVVKSMVFLSGIFKRKTLTFNCKYVVDAVLCNENLFQVYSAFVLARGQLSIQSVKKKNHMVTTKFT